MKQAGLSEGAPTPTDLEDRATGALVGLAIGDALGMPTQLMSHRAILEDYGPITRLRDAGPNQLVASGMPAGSVTDDTEQALLLARLLIAGGGRIDENRFITSLLEWEKGMAAKGSLDLLGPSTKRAVERIASGFPATEAGSDGSTNGAAMRITPVGIAFPTDPMNAFIDAVVDASKVTHNTSIGLAAAAAVGAAVSVGVQGGSLADSISTAVRAADLAAERGHWVAGAHIGSKISWAVQYLSTIPPHRWADEIDSVIGTDVPSQESVVAAFAIAAVTPTAWEAVCLAATVGGDTDTIAAIAGAITGAQGGMQVWPVDVVQQVESVNGLAFQPYVRDLVALRSAQTEN